MTVSSETRKSGPYNGNGSTTVFAYGFRILDASHISVVRTENSLDTVLTTGFTVSGVGSAGGNVTFSVAPSVGQTITLIRNVPLTQEVDLENQGAYYAETVEASLDLAAMRDQQLQEQIDRSVKLAVGTDVANLDLLVANITRLVDSADQVDAVAAIEADVTAVAAIAANVSTVADNLADVTNFADVYQGGKAVAPTTRNDGSALQVGDIYFDTAEDKMKVLNSLLVWEASASSVNGTLSRQVYTATSGQTVFAIVYDVGYVDVWLNGVKLVAGDDFTATDGATVTLAVGATLGDSVDIVAFGTFVLAAMLEKSANLSDVDSVSTARANLGAAPLASPTFTGQVKVAAGTVGAPSLIQAGDVDTGLWFPAANTLAVSLAGAEKARFDGNYLRLAAGGIQFNGDTADANSLDDYEEGSFTPTISGAGVSGAGTYTLQTGRYVKVGKVVTIWGAVSITAHTGSGQMIIGGLPFTTANVANMKTVASILYLNLAVPPSSIAVGFIGPNESWISLNSLATAATGYVSLSIDAACTLNFTATYEAA